MKSPSAMARADASHMLKLCISKSETDPAQTKGAEESRRAVSSIQNLFHLERFGPDSIQIKQDPIQIGTSERMIAMSVRYGVVDLLLNIIYKGCSDCSQVQQQGIVDGDRDIVCCSNSSDEV
eukprot:9483308-Pyramimonas_sp.AAC.3